MEKNSIPEKMERANRKSVFAAERERERGYIPIRIKNHNNTPDIICIIIVIPRSWLLYTYIRAGFSNTLISDRALISSDDIRIIMLLE